MTNIKFNYLYRDFGNYKQHGNVIFANHSNLLIEDIHDDITKNLIDGEYFSADKWSLPSCFFKTFTSDDHEWHEFQNLKFTDELATSAIDIHDFILKMQ
jgi:hypothetical protein